MKKVAVKKKAARKKKSPEVSPLDALVLETEAARIAANEARKSYEVRRTNLLIAMQESGLEEVTVTGELNDSPVVLFAKVFEKFQTKIAKQRLIELIGQEAFNAIAKVTKTDTVRKHGNAVWQQVTKVEPTGISEVTISRSK